MSALLGRIQRHLKSTGMAPTRFGRDAVNDPRLVGDITKGREPGQRTVARIEAFLASQTGKD